MGQPPPHGQSLGIWICTHKVKHEDRFAVIFEQPGQPEFKKEMTAGEAAYYSVGQSYELKATTP